MVVRSVNDVENDASLRYGVQALHGARWSRQLQPSRGVSGFTVQRRMYSSSRPKRVRANVCRYVKLPEYEAGRA